jgi:catechol 2,3-dioxygenase-like lactoylglutathione lyase family enzyme
MALKNQAMSLDVVRIDHVQVTVPRALEAEALHFYGEVLGLERIPKPPDAARRGGAWYRHGAVQVHVGLEDVDAAAQRGSRRHVCYVVANLEDAREKLRAAGCEILADPHPEPGLRRLFVHDPGGNRIEIAE